MVSAILSHAHRDTGNRYSLQIFAAAFVLSSLFSLPARAAVRPAEALARDLVTLVDSADRQKIRAFVKTSVSGEAFKTAGMMGMPLDVETFILGLHDRTAGLDEVRIDSTSPDDATIHGISRATGIDVSVSVRTEDESPFRLTSISVSVTPSITPASAPGDAKELTTRVGSLLDRMEKAGLFAGVVLIADGNDRILLHRSYGEASREFSV